MVFKCFCSSDLHSCIDVVAQVAMEMLFTGTPISAHDALLHGLVSKVVPEERLEAETLAIAQRVCDASRPVVALGKATFQRYRLLTPQPVNLTLQENIV